MPLPLTVSCFNKIQIDFTFLVPAHLGSPGKRAVKWVCVCERERCNNCRAMRRLSHAVRAWCVHLTGIMRSRLMRRTTCTTLRWQLSTRRRYVMYVANCYGVYDWAFYLKHHCNALLVCPVCTDFDAVSSIPVSLHFVTVKLLVSFFAAGLSVCVLSNLRGPYYEWQLYSILQLFKDRFYIGNWWFDLCLFSHQKCTSVSECRLQIIVCIYC